MPASHAVPSPADIATFRRPGVDTAIVFACLALCVLLLVGTANRGFGLTDEAFYVAWIGAPDRYKANITPFGPPLHLLFELLARSLVALRIAGIALLLGSGALLGRALGRYYHAIGLEQVPLAAIAAMGAIASVSYYALWILTPSYNLLANAGGALILAGALGWAAADIAPGRRDGIAAAALIGLGGCIAFFGKPPPAALAALGIAGLIARTIHLQGLRAVLPRLLVLLAACALPLAAVVELTGGFATFVAKFVEGIQVLNFGNSPLSLPLKTFREIFQMPLLVVAGVVLGLVLAWSRGKPSGDDRPLRRAFASFLGFVGLYAIALLTRGVVAGERAWTFVGLPTGCLAMVILAIGPLHGTRRRVPLRAVVPPVVLLFVPFATAIGTANGFVYQTGASPYGFLLAAPVAGWVYFGRKTAGRIQAATAVFALAMLLWSAVRPYSLTGSIIAENTPLRVPFSSDTVLVSPETERYAQALRRVAVVGRLLPTTPIIDLSDGGPGTALLLNAGAPYYPWLIPETKIPGSLAEQAWLSLDAEQRRSAWIIGPMRAEFARTRLGTMLLARRGCYRRFGGLHKVFWDEPKSFEIWVPQKTC